ncbi:MAG: hypothetical protein KF819_12135 [Labilithrix sp.]|nr:hypothetical protein [Labilithrix sp.]
MKRALPLFDRLRITKPCPASWEEMEGDDVSRFCGVCNKHVHNLDRLSSDEVQAMLASGRICGRVRRSALVPAAMAAGAVVFALSAACTAEITDAGGDQDPGTATLSPQASPDAGAPAEVFLLGDISPE